MYTGIIFSFVVFLCEGAFSICWFWNLRIYYKYIDVPDVLLALWLDGTRDATGEVLEQLDAVLVVGDGSVGSALDFEVLVLVRGSLLVEPTVFWNHFPGKAPSMLKVKFECENNIIVVFLSTSWSKWIQQLFNSIRSVIHRQGWQTELLTEFLPPRPSRKRRAARAMPQVSHMKGGRQSGVWKRRLRDIDIPIDNELETAHASYDPEGCLSLLEAAKGAP